MEEFAMKTPEEIIAHCQSADDFFGYTHEVLLPYLSVEQVKPFLKDDADLSDWKQIPLTRESILANMKEYMEFAWSKVEDHRGLSAGRSVEKMQAWLWLLEDAETLAFASDNNNYAQYGAPILRKICDVYDFPVPDGNDIENMAQGKPCVDGCDMGCGRGAW